MKKISIHTDFCGFFHWTVNYYFLLQKQKKVMWANSENNADDLNGTVGVLTVSVMVINCMQKEYMPKDDYQFTEGAVSYEVHLHCVSLESRAKQNQ